MPENSNQSITLIFFDTEFTDLSANSKLISIGLIAATGEHFYAELSDAWRLDDCSEFVTTAVLPHLQGSPLLSMAELSQQLGDWIEQFAVPVTLVTDSEVWDWRWISVLFAAQGWWPQNLAIQPMAIPNDADLRDMIEQCYLHNPGLRRHHALDDANANRLAWLSWRKLQSETANKRQTIFTPSPVFGSKTE